MHNNKDSELKTASYISTSSIENLVNTNVSGSTHAQLLSGPNALGTFFANAGFPYFMEDTIHIIMQVLLQELP